MQIPSLTMASTSSVWMPSARVSKCIR
ncbi:hypothetical protein E2C01_074171 [Portunus trituberculatus]|uniref:Uncharacterized protein n=1 Tax=Portunus trituberculatus TaxID=210409 RepID=A0A5B7IGF2_PORTR|nr:hypothetical protein [Portunus trituberculatus]